MSHTHRQHRHHHRSFLSFFRCGLVREHYPAGFTLIELLVSISIISLMASIVFSSVGGVRVKARNAARAQAVTQLSTAIQFYRDTYGVFPPGELDDPSIPLGALIGDQSNDGTGFIPILAQRKFLPRDIVDPLNTDQNMYIYYWDNGTVANQTGINEHCGATPRASAVLLIVPENGAIKGMQVSPNFPNVNIACFYL